MTNKHIPLLAAPLVFGAVLGASAAPAQIKAAPKPASATTTVVRAVPGGPFRDVPPDHWAAKAVETLRQAGIVRGYPAAPASAQAAKMPKQAAKAK